MPCKGFKCGTQHFLSSCISTFFCTARPLLLVKFRCILCGVFNFYARHGKWPQTTYGSCRNDVHWSCRGSRPCSGRRPTRWDISDLHLISFGRLFFSPCKDLMLFCFSMFSSLSVRLDRRLSQFLICINVHFWRKLSRKKQNETATHCPCFTSIYVRLKLLVGVWELNQSVRHNRFLFEILFHRFRQVCMEFCFLTLEL